MAVVYKVATVIGAVSANPPTFNLTLPTFASGNLAVDDIIVVHVMSKNLSLPTNEINTPTGYSEKGTKQSLTGGVAADNQRVAMFYKRAVSADDGASVTISRGGTSTLGLYGIAYIWRGATNSGDPFDTAGIAIGVGDATADTDIDFPAFDPAADRHAIYFAWHADDGTTTPTDISNGGFTFTFRDEQETATGTDATAMLWSADHDGTALGAVVKSFTSTSGTSIGYVYALIPGTSAQTLTPSAAAAAVTVAAPTLLKGAVLTTPTAVAAAFSVPAPALGMVNTLTPSPASGAFSVAIPGLVRGTVALLPDPAAAAWSVPAPVVLGAGQMLTPSPAGAAWTVAAPTVLKGAVVLTPSAAAALFGVAVPLLVEGAVTLTPNPALGFFTVQPVTIPGAAGDSDRPLIGNQVSWFMRPGMGSF